MGEDHNQKPAADADPAQELGDKATSDAKNQGDPSASASDQDAYYGWDDKDDEAIPEPWIHPGATQVDRSSDRGSVQAEYQHALMRFSFLGIEFGVAVALGFFGGRWLDTKTDTFPLFALLGVAIGIAAAAKDFYKAVRVAQARMSKDGEPTDEDQDVGKSNSSS